MNKNILSVLLLVVIVLPFILSTSKVSAATFTVTNTNTSGAGSLVQAINDANATAGQDTITFSATGNIDMANASLPALTDSVIFNGPGVANLSISNTTIYTNSASNLASLSFSNLNMISPPATTTLS